MNPTIDRVVRSLSLYGLFLCAASPALAAPPVFVGTATATMCRT